ncbi:MAG: hypothetical protein HC849_20175 [Oscillatoriales cyanobacterium RU_3_3]|nr:hypothetical protein [Microcoleus sp. SU_5_6]NJM61986.1 hypothetical protein [Oscillatoriales cyanobacterium RU_3_3]NJR24418.1 hypothetical protein [Richelia sp. CSU_2_1]
MGCNLQFKTGQIVSLECGDACLYAEVIQVVESRQICWARPLMLAVLESGKDAFDRAWEDGTLYDLREGADLLWPLNLFQAAVDVEVISLLTQLQSLDAKKKDAAMASRQLRDFVDRVWEAHPNAFK